MGSRNRCRDGMDQPGGSARKGPHQSNTLMGTHTWLPMGLAMTKHINDYLAEWFVRTSSPYEPTKPDHRISAPVMQAGLSMVGWILKREVRAIGGCLGIHRR